jgi:hypothetical protein
MELGRYRHQCFGLKGACPNHLVRRTGDKTRCDVYVAGTTELPAGIVEKDGTQLSLFVAVHPRCTQQLTSHARRKLELGLHSSPLLQRG